MLRHHIEAAHHTCCCYLYLEEPLIFLVCLRVLLFQDPKYCSLESSRERELPEGFGRCGDSKVKNGVFIMNVSTVQRAVSTYVSLCVTTSDVFEVPVIGELVAEEGKLFESLQNRTCLVRNCS